MTMTDTTVASTNAEPYWISRPGVAPVKPEFVLWDKVKSIQPNDRSVSGSTAMHDDEAEGRTFRTAAKPDGSAAAAHGPTSVAEDVTVSTETPDVATQEGDAVDHSVKKVRLSGAEKKKLAFARRDQERAEQQGRSLGANDDTSRQKQKRGQNKNRTFHHSAGTEAIRLCTTVAKGRECIKTNGQICRWDHDLSNYMNSRLANIRSALPTSVDDLTPVESDHSCPSFDNMGECPHGFKCRFGSAHIKKIEQGAGFQGFGWQLIVDENKRRQVAQELGPSASDKGEYNLVTMDTIKKVRGQGASKEDRFPLSREYLTSIGDSLDARDFGGKSGKDGRGGKRQRNSLSRKEEAHDVDGEDAGTSSVQEKAVFVAVDADEEDPSRVYVPDVARVRSEEKKRLDWNGKLYLAPLTTVGNLPFRRLCADYGCDITCSEMGLAQEFLSGNANEWSLVRRHPSEKMFGVQICGSRPSTLVPAAEAIVKNCEIDFLDVNCGCPIDLVFNKGAGSALLGHATKLGKSLVGMSKVLGEVPLTIKIRNGISNNSPVAHKLMPRFQQEWPVSAVTLHGRSRAQRYKQLADYSYIAQCAQVLRETAADEGLAPIPIFGNGDIYDYRQYYDRMEQTKVDGIMVARGGLIKPWIFTEIKERRDWDISASERLDMVSQLVNHGLEHWGSDQIGVNHVRRFVCESLSFTHRYVPVGMLERLPAQLNERPLPFKGRNELETLLASDRSSDWVKITEMFLGPAPADWSFQPKHRANATADTEVQG